MPHVPSWSVFWEIVQIFLWKFPMYPIWRIYAVIWVTYWNPPHSSQPVIHSCPWKGGNLRKYSQWNQAESLEIKAELVLLSLCKVVWRVLLVTETVLTAVPVRIHPMFPEPYGNLSKRFPGAVKAAGFWGSIYLVNLSILWFWVTQVYHTPDLGCLPTFSHLSSCVCMYMCMRVSRRIRRPSVN